jgi:pyruvate kinase
MLGLGVEFLALSFVSGPGDVQELRELIPEGDITEIVAKIERPEALDRVDEILEAADAIMVARGDLGVELPPEEVPVVQRQLIAAARAHGKPSIVATQMLESMIESPQPTRAEVSDVSTAVFSGADAVMLSAETASGRFPLAAVQIMDRIARQIESHQFSEHVFGGIPEAVEGEMSIRDAVARSTAQLSRDLRVRGIVVLAEADQTAEVVSAARPAAPVVAVASDPKRAGQLGLQWGVVPIRAPESDLADPKALARRLARDLGLATSGQYVLMVAGFGTTVDSDVPSVVVLRA